MKTTAERFAVKFLDGQSYQTTAHGIDLFALAARAGARASSPAYEVHTLDFPDGSRITVSGAAWDLGYPGCECWQGIGHTCGA